MRHHPLRKQAHRLHDAIVRQRSVIDFKCDLREAEPFHQHRDFLNAFLGAPITARVAFICSRVMLSRFSKNPFQSL
jgi:hypothetical protein